MKRAFPVVLAVIFLLALLALWIETPYVIHELSSRVALVSPEKCESVESQVCADLFSRMGATGDTFGATSSLFSSLALFLVALTLWFDGRARREVRKPLLISTLGAESARLDDPKLDSDGSSSIRLFFSFSLSNRSPDAALNVGVRAQLLLKMCTYKITSIDVGMPIAGTESQYLEASTRIDGDLLQQLLTDLTGPTTESVIEVETIYTNLEGTSWSTKVSYGFERISSIDRQRLNSVRGDQNEVANLWSGDAAVELVPVLKAGSWKHSRT